MDIKGIKEELNLTNDEIDEIIFIESLENKQKYISCEKCGKRILKAEAKHNCCFPCFIFWYC